MENRIFERVSRKISNTIGSQSWIWICTVPLTRCMGLSPLSYFHLLLRPLLLLPKTTSVLTQDVAFEPSVLKPLVFVFSFIPSVCQQLLCCSFSCHALCPQQAFKFLPLVILYLCFEAWEFGNRKNRPQICLLALQPSNCCHLSKVT